MKMSKAWIAALVLGMFLTGCGGSSGGGDSTSTTSTQSNSQSVNTGDVERVGDSSSLERPQDTLKERTAVLSWNAPLTRENEESLKMAELAGYVIRYGQNPSSLDAQVELTDAGTMEYTFQELGDGTWYFAVQAIDNNGLMSDPSEVVSKTI